jgi:hypothetical protein
MPTPNRTIDIDTLEAIAEQVNGDVRANYSGRGMYGDTCVGITHANQDALLGVVIGAMVDPELALWMGHNARTDDMGLNTITYWPGLTLNEEDI